MSSRALHSQWGVSVRGSWFHYSSCPGWFMTSHKNKKWLFIDLSLWLNANLIPLKNRFQWCVTTRLIKWWKSPVIMQQRYCNRGKFSDVTLKLQIQNWTTVTIMWKWRYLGGRVVIKIIMWFVWDFSIALHHIKQQHKQLYLCTLITRSHVAWDRISPTAQIGLK